MRWIALLLGRALIASIVLELSLRSLPLLPEQEAPLARVRAGRTER